MPSLQEIRQAAGSEKWEVQSLRGRHEGRLGLAGDRRHDWGFMGGHGHGCQHAALGRLGQQNAKRVGHKFWDSL